MCRLLEVSPAGFYSWLKRPESQHDRDDRRLAMLVRAAHETGRRTYGSPRIHAAMAASGVRISRKRVMRLMQEQGLRARIRRRYVKTTDSTQTTNIAPNLLNREFTALAPNRRWVGDVTYLKTPGAPLYLAAIVDLFSRRVVGWAVSVHNDTDLALKALQRAILLRAPGADLMHHTDRGSPYASAAYRAVLAEYGFDRSMSRAGECYDNAAMESWFHTLKVELGESFESVPDAIRKLFDYIEIFYNGKRLHSTLGYVSPREFERRHALAGSTV